LAYRSAAAVSYSISSRVSVGVSMSAVYNANTLVMPYVFQSNPSLAGLKTLLDLHTSGFGWNSAFGITARPTSHWEFGAAYRTHSAIVSNGTATGNMGAQFAALGIPFQPAFSYRGQVKVEIPQSALLNIGWQRSPVLRLNFQTDWTNWNRSFANLPVTLTQGTNSDINGFLGTTGIKDVIPLNWKDQFSFRFAAERKLLENVTVSAGYVHRNNPVPSSTLSPLTAAIMGNGISAGLGYSRGIARFDVAYQINLIASQSVGTSALLSGDFSQSRLKVGTQGLILSTSFHL
jgi:long-subunit fatty acid transport protein